MDAESVKSWCKLYNITNDTFLKIFKDKISINNYKEKCEELQKEIILMNEQSESYAKANDTLENQVKQLKESYERKVKDLPFYSNVYNRLRDQLTDSEQRYQEKETYLKGIMSSEQQKYEDLIIQSDAVWPECGQLKEQKMHLNKLQLDLKIQLQSIEDERSKIRMKKDIHQKLFNSAIVDFVKRITDQQENQRVIEEIGRYTRDGNLLLKEYDKALMNAEKRKRNEESSRYDQILKFRKDDLPQIERQRILSPSLSTSSLMNLSSCKIVTQNNAALEKYKDREMERKKRLHELTKQSLLHCSPSKYKKPASEPQPQPTPKRKPTGKVQILSQVYMPSGANVKENIGTHAEPRETKMPRLNSGSQFGSQGDKKDVPWSFGKSQEVEAKRGGFTSMQGKQLTGGSESARATFAEKNFKGGQGEYAPFGGFSQASEKEQQKPQKEKAPEEQNAAAGESKKMGFSGKKMSFEKEESSFFNKPKAEQKKAPSPARNISDDEVFKIPKSSFDFNTSFNQVASADNKVPNMMDGSYEMPICFSPPYKNDAEPEQMFSDKDRSPKGGFFFFP